MAKQVGDELNVVSIENAPAQQGKVQGLMEQGKEKVMDKGKEKMMEEGAKGMMKKSKPKLPELP